MKNNLVKVVVRLEPGEDDYPPASEEGLWAEDPGGGLFRIDNIPFFAKDLALNDVVRAERVGEDLIVTDLVSRSGHSTIRVILFDKLQLDTVRAALHQLGCASELSHIPTLVAIDVPANVDIRAVRGYLDDRAAEGVLDHEEAALRQD